MKLTCIVCVLLFSNYLKAQVVEKDIIILFNEKVEKGVSNMITLDLIKNGDLKYSFKARYTPGALVIDSSIFAEAQNVDYDIIDFRMDLNKLNSDGTVEKCSYSFSMPQEWMNATYIIINIFDMNIKKYRRLFRTNANYVYEMESDMGNATSIRKKR